MVQTTLWCVENKGLFSNHFLEKQLLTMDEWKEPENIENTYHKIKQLYNSKQLLLPNAKESQLRDEFLNPILKYLGHNYKVEGKTEGASKYPDYGLFHDEKSADEAIKDQGTENFYKNAIAICEAKSWEIKLDERDPDNPEPDKRTPNRQIDDYLRWSEKKWGILMNGRFWRLYYRENSYRNYYYQVDLAEIIENNDIDAFKYFFLFFRKKAFEPDVNNICFLDNVYQGSVDYAKEIGENVQENVYNAMKILTKGFIDWTDNNLAPTKENLELIQENTMKFLYRLLFIFFAEANGLLDLSNENYKKSYSLYSVKEKIAYQIKQGESIPKYSDTYWSKLDNLFRLINMGTLARGIRKKELSIPSYNGGLFDPEKNEFLVKNKIGDSYIAEAIDLLARSKGKKMEEKGFFDYSSLDIRHLGSIYEGLLEYKLRVATEPMVAVKEKGKEKWILESEFKGKKYIERVEASEIYLATDKEERKATGSYYTPEYIVKYIVENTLTPIVKEKMKIAIERNEKCSDAILSIKVLDPAMGSGHFLVDVVDFLAHHLGDAINKDIERKLMREGEYPDEWLRREIVSHCIYGVDLNLMAVELAKVSLWLKTISKDKPLSFLDHRLKYGNSLIGTDLEDLPWYPLKKVKKTQKRLDVPEGFIKKLVDTTKKLSDISDETLNNIKRKEEIFKDLLQTREYDMINTLADVRCSIYFGNKIDESTYGNYTGDAYWSSESEWFGSERNPPKRDRWFARDARKIGDEKNFFHWELEFPEIFFEDGKIKENPGFDAVVGNPPYANIEDLKDDDKNFLETVHPNIFRKKNDQLYHFILVYKTLCRPQKGYIGVIISRYFNEAQNADLFRNFLKNNYIFIEWNDFENLELFSGINTRCVIPILKIGNPIGNVFFARRIVKWKENHEALFRCLTQMGRKINFDLKSILAFDYCQDLLPQNDPWRILPEKLLKMKSKIESNSIVLGGKKGLCNIAMGWNTGLDDAFTLTKTEFERVDIEKDACVPIIKNGGIKRYSITHSGSVWINLNGKNVDKYPKALSILEKSQKNLEKRYAVTKVGKKWYEFAVVNAIDLFKTIPKIITPFKAPENRFAIDNYGLLGSQDIYALAVRENFNQIDSHYIVALLNSHLMTWSYQWFYGRRKKAEFDYYTNLLKQVPIRCINFTTPQEERTSIVKKGKDFYKNKNFTLVLDLVDKCLPKDKEGNFNIEKEKSDVIHDFLAYLAEQMLEMNKQKQNEINGLLDWFEGYIKLKVDDMVLKTNMREYYKHDWDEIKRILTRNKKKITEFDITRREPLEKIEIEYKESVKKLKPLLARIAATDNLIDQIVYKLYGLTNDEIRIVKESFMGKAVETEEVLPLAESE